MPQFFIDRPVFAWVVALFILLAGALAIPQLPVAQYPTSRRHRSKSTPCTLAPRRRPSMKAWSA